AVGPLIVVSHINAYGLTTIFVFSTIMAVVCLILGLTVRAPQMKRAKPTGGNASSLGNCSEKTARPVCIRLFLLAVACSGILSYMTAYADSINRTQAGSLYFTVYGITVLCSRPITGPLLDRKGANIVMYPAIISFAIGLFVIGQANSTLTFL